MFRIILAALVRCTLFVEAPVCARALPRSCTCARRRACILDTDMHTLTRIHTHAHSHKCCLRCPSSAAVDLKSSPFPASLRPSTPTERLPQGAQHPLEGAPVFGRDRTPRCGRCGFPQEGRRDPGHAPPAPVTVTVNPASYLRVLDSTLTLVTAGHCLRDVWRVLPAPGPQAWCRQGSNRGRRAFICAPSSLAPSCEDLPSGGRSPGGRGMTASILLGSSPHPGPSCPGALCRVPFCAFFSTRESPAPSQ